MALCDKCKEWFDRTGIRYAPCDHCHHDEENRVYGNFKPYIEKGCEWCKLKETRRSVVVFTYLGKDSPHYKIIYCPVCGRKL